MSSNGLSDLPLEQNDRTILRHFVESWDAHRGLVVFVGAGFSSFQAKRLPTAPDNAKFGTWQDLCDAFSQALSNDDEVLRKRLPADPLRLAELFEKEFSRRKLQDLIAQHVPSAHFAPGDAHIALREMPLAAVITGNYDDLLERTFLGHRAVHRVARDEDLTEIARPDDLPLIKIHGDLALPETIVITEEDYREFDSKKPGIAVKVRQLMIEHPILFVGFSLADPHYARLDGWIRDTAKKMRLRSVAVMHGALGSADHRMWKERGTNLVRLPGGAALGELLRALTAEWRSLRRTSIPPASDSQKVLRLEQEIQAHIESPTPDAATVAGILAQIVQEARPESPSGVNALRVVRWLAWGWRHMLDPVTDVGRRRRVASESSAPKVRLFDIYNALQKPTQKQLLLAVVQSGELLLRFSRSHEIDVGNELLHFELTPDERGTLHLNQARIYRERGDSAQAQSALRDAQRANPSATVQRKIEIEQRELSFLVGDSSQIKNALARPLIDDRDALAMCRRGSDSLLLDDREVASMWYKKAHECAKNGDERYVALQGMKVATYDERAAFGGGDRGNDEILRAIEDIRHDERPAVEATRQFLDRAAQAALAGAGGQDVVAGLERYLSGLRDLGWPHTYSHSIGFGFEGAVRNAAKFLLSGEGGFTSDGAVERIKQGLTLLNIYGLAVDVGKLFTSRHCSILSRSSADVEWFRKFVQTRPTVQRARDARLTTAVCGLMLLEDSRISGVVSELCDFTRQWISDLSNNDLVKLWWEEMREQTEGLPVDAVRDFLSVAIDAMNADRHGTAIPVDSIARALGRWSRLRYIGSELQLRVVSFIESELNRSRAANDGWVRHRVSQLLHAVVNADFLSVEQQGRLGDCLDELLSQLLDDDGADSSVVLQVASFALAVRPTTRHRAALAARAVSFAKDELRSSMLAVVLYVIEKLLDAVSDADRLVLADMLLDEAHRRGQTGDDRLLGEEPVRMLCALSDMPERRDVIVSRVGELMRASPGRYGGHVDFGKLWRGDVASAARMALAVLSAVDEDRFWGMWSIAEWLESGPQDLLVSRVVGVLPGLLLSDKAEIRRVAAIALQHARRGKVLDDVTREAVFCSVVGLASADRDWAVRVVAIQALPHMWQGDVERGVAGAAIDEMAKADIALLRRAAELARATLDSREQAVPDAM